MTLTIFPSLETFHGNQIIIKNIMMWLLKGYYTTEGYPCLCKIGPVIEFHHLHKRFYSYEKGLASFIIQTNKRTTQKYC